MPDETMSWPACLALCVCSMSAAFAIWGFCKFFFGTNPWSKRKD